MLAHGFQIRRGVQAEVTELVRIDDEASTLFDSVDITLQLPPDHWYVLADAERWGRALAAGDTFAALDNEQVLVGFALLMLLDGAPYLEQLSVLPRAMRRGVGSALLAKAIEWSAGRPLWLTTYAHVPWNAPFYERFGFSRVPEQRLGPQLRQALADQRKVLPFPEQRVAMLRAAAT